LGHFGVDKTPLMFGDTWSDDILAATSRLVGVSFGVASSWIVFRRNRRSWLVLEGDDDASWNLFDQ